MNPRPRRGGVCILALMVIAVVSVFLALLARQHLQNRQSVARRQNQVQAAWLARSGLEIAAARLLESPEGYTETATLLPDSEVRIEVKKVKPDVFEVTTEAVVAKEDRNRTRGTATRRFQRVVVGGRATLLTRPDG